jgi:hypothetical protein
VAFRCGSIAGQRVSLGPGSNIISGCELIDGSALINAINLGEGGTEVFPPVFFSDEDLVAYASDDGATVIWPETGNDVYQYSRGESIPVGTDVHQGQVNDGGEWFDAPHTVENEGASAGPADSSLGFGNDGTADGDEGDSGEQNPTRGTPPDDGEREGFCDPNGIFPGEEDKQFLLDLANLKIPDLKLFNLSGFTAYITKQLTKVSSAVAKVQQEVDAIVDKAKLDPDKICTPPVKRRITQLTNFIKAMMKLMPVLMAILQVIKLIKRALKIVRKILKWTPPFIVPIVEKLMDMLALMGLVDMVVNLLIQTVGKFNAILPMLYAQLISILAGCVEEPLDSKENCEANGVGWVDPEDVAELQELYEQMERETSAISAMASSDYSNIGDGDSDRSDSGIGGVSPDGDAFGFCSIVEHTNQKDCEAVGGTWTDLSVDTDFDQVDTSALTDELAKQIEELDKCFADPILKDYLVGL